MRCKLTGREGEGVKAHVIPRAFYRIDPNEAQPMRILGTGAKQYPRSSHVGEYDSEMVTEEGERVFSPWDDYADKLLIKGRGQLAPIVKGLKDGGYIIAEYDYAKLKLFVLSVLWRASVTSRPFFSNVELGPYEVAIREALLHSRPGNPEWCSVIFETWNDQDAYGSFLDPQRCKVDEVNFYCLYLENYTVYVKIDQRPTPAELEPLQLSPDSPLIMLARSLKGSKEEAVMKQALQNHAQS